MSQRVKLVIVGSATILTSWAIYESYQINQKMRKPLNTKFLDRRCQFIYIDRNYLREPVKDFMTEIFHEETLIHSFLYNIKKKLTFTKVIRLTV